VKNSVLLIDRRYQTEKIIEIMTINHSEGQVLGMVFEKSSTRTVVSFETGMAHFGGHSVFLSPRDTQLGRGEPVEDSAKVISRMVDCVMLRTHSHDTRIHKICRQL
jgi:ornithine carbamoyltransferase